MPQFTKLKDKSKKAPERAFWSLSERFRGSESSTTFRGWNS